MGAAKVLNPREGGGGLREEEWSGESKVRCWSGSANEGHAGILKWTPGRSLPTWAKGRATARFWVPGWRNERAEMKARQQVWLALRV